MRVADYLFRVLADCGVRHVFMVTGGRRDAPERCFGPRFRPDLHLQPPRAGLRYGRRGLRPRDQPDRRGVRHHRPWRHQRAQRCVWCLDGFDPTGWFSGQVKRETCLRSYDLPGLRQLGDQEADIISMVKGITKYAVSVTASTTIRYHLDRALLLATSGRPGPCGSTSQSMCSPARSTKPH